jgi:hypothetical protein
MQLTTSGVVLESRELSSGVTCEASGLISAVPLASVAVGITEASSTVGAVASAKL